jgi:hypothetical protein
VIVEKVERAIVLKEIAVLKVEIVESSWPVKTLKFEAPLVVILPIDVLRVEKVDRILNPREDRFEPTTVEKLEIPPPV